MKNLGAVFTRFVLAVAAIMILFLTVNIVLFLAWAYEQQTPPFRADYTKTFSDSLTWSANGYVLAQKALEDFSDYYIWAMLLDFDGHICWQYQLPAALNRSYTLTDVAAFSRWYLDDYPVATWNRDDGLLVLGSEKNLWKKVLETPLSAIESTPQLLKRFIALNIAFALALSLLLGLWLLRALKPFAQGIDGLSAKTPVKLPPKGPLKNLAVSINTVSDRLAAQEEALALRDQARANWISGISHDVRTPLSMILGYADSLSRSTALPQAQREQAAIIRQQGLRIRDLVQNLNLAAKLEYNMQPINRHIFYPAALLRQIIAQYLNDGLSEKYQLTLDIAPQSQLCRLNADENLLSRAISNLINNAINHNPQGCAITVTMTAEAAFVRIAVSDNGVGVPPEKYRQLTQAFLQAPNTLDRSLEMRHGLGLLIVSQIVAAACGTLAVSPSPSGGFLAEMRLPLTQEAPNPSAN